MASEQIAYAVGWAPAAVTPRGTAALRLSECGDVWEQLTAANRECFSELLVDACDDEAAPR